MVRRENRPAVPVLYLDQGFLADRASWALRFAQIVREFGDLGGPTPAASTTRLQVVDSYIAARRGTLPAFLVLDLSHRQGLTRPHWFAIQMLPRTSVGSV